jgi:predicted ATPase
MRQRQAHKAAIDDIKNRNMIKKILITNFYSFGEVAIPLHPNTNILIGINGSGKSNFLKAIRLLKEGVDGVGLKRHILDNLGGFDNMFFKGYTNGNATNKISIEYTLDGSAISEGKYGFRFTEDIVYTIVLIKSPSFQNYYIKENLKSERGYVYLDFTNGEGYLNEKVEEEVQTEQSLIKYTDFDPQELVIKEVSDTDRYNAITTVKKAIRDIFVYDYFDTTPKSNIRKPMLPSSEKRLFPDGTNLPQILNTIKINYKSSYKKIADMLNEVNSNFSGFDFNFIGGNIELMLEEKGLNSSVHVSNISDGTLRYLCLLSILFNPDRGRLVCIDEPEVGLHPDMIVNIANAIKEASEASTLIVSTHSENLLNYFEVENLRVFEKNQLNSTEVNSYTSSQFVDWYEEFSIGQMWKQGDLGGVRYGS